VDHTAHRAAARSHLGVCPQLDAMNSTVSEHLYFYARARGVPRIAANISAALSAVGLDAFKNRMANALSGNNKHKLSLAITLMGNPSVLLLDEPSSGMGAVAKRIMWKTLLGVVAPGRALFITTYSMEDADTLATRIGIVKGHWERTGRCEIGSDAWMVHLVPRSALHTTKEEMERVRAWIEANIPGEELPDVTVAQVKMEEGDRDRPQRGTPRKG
jgi:ATP-binding cassette subfamily A (ABC1) protein 3